MLSWLRVGRRDGGAEQFISIGGEARNGSRPFVRRAEESIGVMNPHQHNKSVPADQFVGHVLRPGGTSVNGMRSGSTRKPRFALSHHVELAKDAKAFEAAIKRAQTALLNLQHPDGYWLGELEANSTLYSDYVAFMHWSGASIDRGVAYLLNRQQPDGGWDENLPTGTGFPGVLYLRYDLYRKYWPLRALATYASCLKRLGRLRARKILF